MNHVVVPGRYSSYRCMIGTCGVIEFEYNLPPQKAANPALLQQEIQLAKACQE